MKKAAMGGRFLPALVDIGRFIIGGVGVESPDAKAGRAVLWDAHKLGHKMALVYVAEVMQRDASLLLRLLGALLHPVAAARASKFILRQPFSDEVFAHTLDTHLFLSASRNR
jgi:hypothetical protein